MRIGMVVTPLNESNLRVASQIGVTDIVGRYPGPKPEDVVRLRTQIEAAGMKLTVIEGYVPMKNIVLGLPEREKEIDAVCMLIESMGNAGVPVLCYNFLPTGDMTRSSFNVPDRGGALVNRFDLKEYQSLDRLQPGEAPISMEAMWDNLTFFLRKVLPVAERAGVKLAMHPDDPPGFARLHGQPRIMSKPEDFDRLVNLVSNPSNGVCFCQGCFSEMGIDVVAAIHRLGPYIHYVHFRDVVGCSPSFHETFHDCGQTNMPAAMRAYRDIGYTGIMRPDHVPVLEGEKSDASGYTMMGRLFAVGYMRGLIQAIQSETSN